MTCGVWFKFARIHSCALAGTAMDRCSWSFTHMHTHIHIHMAQLAICIVRHKQQEVCCTCWLTSGRLASLSSVCLSAAMCKHSPLGMTWTRAGGRPARRTVFSRLVWLTQITACTSAKTPLSSLLVRMLAASAKPNRLWSVNTTYSEARAGGITPEHRRQAAFEEAGGITPEHRPQADFVVCALPPSAVVMCVC